MAVSGGGAHFTRSGRGCFSRGPGEGNRGGVGRDTNDCLPGSGSVDGIYVTPELG